MQSKRSFFNLALFKKNLSRSWPLWGSITAAGCLVPLYLLLALMQHGSRYVDHSDFAQVLYGVATGFVPAASLIYAILVAMVVWSFLYNNRSVGMMHTLPIHRTGLFLTNALSGLAMLLIPYAAVGLLVCLIALGWGFMDFTAVLVTVVAVLLLTVLFFGMATLCAMITGNVFALPAFYLIANFLAVALDWLVSTLCRDFLVGVRSDYTGMVEFLSPVIEIYQKFRWRGMYFAENVYQPDLVGFHVVAIYGLVGVVFFALAWLLYRKRASESAGDVVAFKWLKPVFRYGVALCSALTMGRLLYALIWENLFQKGEYADLLPMIVCMAVAGLVGYYAASMLLEKSLRVFRKSGVGAAAVCVGAAVLCLCVSMDIMGVERHVPEADEVDSVYIYASDMIGDFPDIDGQTQPEVLADVLALHSAIVADLDRVRYLETNRSLEVGEERTTSYQYLTIRYYLADGSELRRNYNLVLEKDNWQQEVSYEGAFKALFADNDMQIYQVGGHLKHQPDYLYVYDYENGHHSTEEGYDLDQKALYSALLRDAEEGNLYDYDPFDDYYNENYPVRLELEIPVMDEETYDRVSHDYFSLELRPTMTHTIENLLEQGFLTGEDLVRWVDQGLREPAVANYKDWGIIGGADGPARIVVGG